MSRDSQQIGYARKLMKAAAAERDLGKAVFAANRVIDYGESRARSMDNPVKMTGLIEAAEELKANKLYWIDVKYTLAAEARGLRERTKAMYKEMGLKWEGF